MESKLQYLSNEQLVKLIIQYKDYQNNITDDNPEMLAATMFSIEEYYKYYFI